MAEQKEHPHEAHLLKFLQREDQTADYVRRTAEFIKTEYPGSAKRLIPLLRKIYREKRKAGGA